MSDDSTSEGMDEEPGLRVPDVAGYIEGYRWFRVAEGRLWSQNAGAGRGGFTGGGTYEWVPGPNEAVCFTEPSSWARTVLKNGPDGKPVPVEITCHSLIPDPACNCGFWFYPQPDVRGGERWDGVLGRIRAWGKVIEGAHGWRSEFAEILVLYAKYDEAAKELEEVARYYRVEIVRPEELVYSGMVMSVSDPEKAVSGKWRPLIVRMQRGDGLEKEQREFKVWPSAEMQGRLLASVGKMLAFRYRVEQNPGYADSWFIEETFPTISDILNGTCWQCKVELVERECPNCGRMFTVGEGGGRFGIKERTSLPADVALRAWIGTPPSRLLTHDLRETPVVLIPDGWMQSIDAAYAEFDL